MDETVERLLKFVGLILAGLIMVGVITVAASIAVWMVSWVIYGVFHALPFPGL